MDKISAIIIDDEFFAREILINLITINCPEIKLVGQAHDIKSAIECITSLKPELVFLDIQLGDANGFSILSELDNIDFDLVFTSAHNNYGVSAFKVNAIDFILKPIDPDDLIMAVKKVVEKRSKISLADKPQKNINVHVNDQVKIISSSEIITLVAQNNYTEINTIDNKKWLTPRTLSSIYESLSDLSFFIRINRSIVVNSSFIKSYTKSDPCIILMNDGSEFEISRRKRTQVLSTLKNI